MLVTPYLLKRSELVIQCTPVRPKAGQQYQSNFFLASTLETSVFETLDNYMVLKFLK